MGVWGEVRWVYGREVGWMCGEGARCLQLIVFPTVY